MFNAEAVGAKGAVNLSTLLRAWRQDVVGRQLANHEVHVGPSSELGRLTLALQGFNEPAGWKFWLRRGPFRPARGPTGCPTRGAAIV